MNRRANQNKKILKTFKDYLVPIFFVFIILIFVVSSLFTWEKQEVIDSWDNSFLSVSLSSPQTEAYIEYNGGNKTKVETEVSLYKSEKLQVVSESVKLFDKNIKFHLNRLWELRYNEDKSYTLYSSDLWAEVEQNILVEMRYAKVQANSGSVFSLSQNEVASTIYVVSGILEVQNLAGKSTVLQKWEKIVIMRNNANDEKSDLALTKELIDDYTKEEEWFIKNNGNSYLSQTEDSSHISTTSTGQYLSQWNEYILFTKIFDEAEITTDKIDLEGTIVDERVVTININGKNAEIDNQNNTFLLKDLSTPARINDIIYKIYDTNSNLLSKWVLTLHNSKWSQSGNAAWTSSSGLAGVQNYPISSSPLYQIISPKQNPYTTTENVVRIEGTVPARTVTKIVINDFQLQKFIQNSTYWQYFANSEFGNLKPWVNIYKIQFFSWDDIIYEMNYTIIKEEKTSETQSVEE